MLAYLLDESQRRSGTMSESTSFVQLSAENISTVSRRLKKDGGFVLTVESALNWNFTITLYDRPVIILTPTLTISDGHRGSNATNPLNDREYRFSKKEEKKGLDYLFDSFDSENYRLAIVASLGVTTWPNLKQFRYWYVPKREQLAEAFTYLFKDMTAIFNPPLKDSEIEGMIAYILDDLETKAEIKKNVRAGMDADAVYGMA